MSGSLGWPDLAAVGRALMVMRLNAAVCSVWGSLVTTTLHMLPRRAVGEGAFGAWPANIPGRQVASLPFTQQHTKQHQTREGGTGVQ